jgi:hypothetical protein
MGKCCAHSTPEGSQNLDTENSQATLEYEITLEDLVAFEVYHLRNSPTASRYNWLGVAFPIFLGAAVIKGFCDGMKSSWWVELLAIGSFLLVCLTLLPRMRRWVQRSRDRRYERISRRLFAEGSNASYVGTRRLRTAANGLECTSKMSAGSTDYAVIGPIKETPDHVFAYTGARSAMVIPKRGRDVTLLSRFVSELTRHIEIAKVGSAIEIKAG